MKFTNFKVKKAYKNHSKKLKQKNIDNIPLLYIFFSNNRLILPYNKYFKTKGYFKVQKITMYFENNYKLVFIPNTNIFVLFYKNKRSNKDIDNFTRNKKPIVTIYN